MNEMYFAEITDFFFRLLLSTIFSSNTTLNSYILSNIIPMNFSEYMKLRICSCFACVYRVMRARKMRKSSSRRVLSKLPSASITRYTHS